MKAKTRAPRRFISYLRASTQQRGPSGLGIEGQRNLVRQLLSGTEDFSPMAEYVEHEADSKVDRPELLKALRACRVHDATLVIARLDHLSRNRQFLMSLLDSSVDVLFCDLPQLPVGATGRFMLEQMAAVSELEARVISERTKAALKAKVARDGQWDRKASHHLVPGAGQQAATAAAKAKAATRAADLRPYLERLKAEGITTLGGLSEKLNQEGVTTARGGKWTAAALKRVLEREAT